eukprot:TRINITY_DN20673_c0_g1_i2.p1 TRINITY_DN20673_c0_g1~~TRINITY_DN20673_c0_g1_i2.p1  ORF type:complete len:529 (+),score=74.23 TRINITY_DN20673_c0_g1_i2:81-1667(+)
MHLSWLVGLLRFSGHLGNVVGTQHIPLQRFQTPPVFSEQDLAELRGVFDGRSEASLERTPPADVAEEVGSMHANMQAPDDALSSLASISADGTVAVNNLLDVHEVLRNFNDVFYTAKVEIGTPPQPANLIVDTGSSDMWVKVPPQDHLVASLTGTSYSANQSDTIHFLGGVVHKIYGKGEIVGSKVDDKVCIEKSCITKQRFLLVNVTVGFGIDTAGFDGLLGLGFPALASWAQGQTVLDRLASNLGPKEGVVFSLLLTSDAMMFDGVLPDSSMSIASSLDELLDTTVSPHRSGAQTTVHVLPVRLVPYGPPVYLYWLVQCQVEAGNVAIVTATILDSGTSLITLPEALLAKVLKQILPPKETKLCRNLPRFPGQTFCFCSAPVKPVTFTFGNVADGDPVTIELGYQDLLQPIAQLGDQTICRLTLTATPRQMPFIILGEAFLRQAYTIYDVKEKTVTLVPRGLHSSGPQVEKPVWTGPSASSGTSWFTILGTAVLSALLMLLLVQLCNRLSARERPSVKAEPLLAAC